MEKPITETRLLDLPDRGPYKNKTYFKTFPSIDDSEIAGEFGNFSANAKNHHFLLNVS